MKKHAVKKRLGPFFRTNSNLSSEFKIFHSKWPENFIFAKFWGQNIGQKHRFLTTCQNGYFILSRMRINKILKAEKIRFSDIKILDLSTFQIAAKNGRQITVFSRFDDFGPKIVICLPFLAAMWKLPRSKVLMSEKRNFSAFRILFIRIRAKIK